MVSLLTLIVWIYIFIDNKNWAVEISASNASKLNAVKDRIDLDGTQVQAASIALPDFPDVCICFFVFRYI